MKKRKRRRTKKNKKKLNKGVCFVPVLNINVLNVGWP